MSADFRQLAIRGQSGRAERLFRAAISAFCALARPTRRDAARLDDLALPLFDSVPPASRRFAAAALSECERAPAGLIRRLAHEPVEISAPLLIRSRGISDVDLITAIGRHGLPHARAIARRPDLHPAIANLLDAFKDPEIQRLRSTQVHVERPEGEAAENARNRLRAMMLPSRLPSTDAPNDARTFTRLRETALSGYRPLFDTALADALGIEFYAAQALTRQGSYRDLASALCRLKLSEEQAYLIVSAVFPGRLSGAEAARLFLHQYRLLAGEAGFPRPVVIVPDTAAHSGFTTEIRSSAA